MILSHRVLRYATPALHLIVLATNVALVAEGAGRLYEITLWLQGAVILASLLGGVGPLRCCGCCWSPAITCSPTSALVAGLWDWLAHGTSASWTGRAERADGER